MVSCAVANCKNSSGKITKSKDGITFHRFPRDKSRCRQWELAVNRTEEWMSTTFSAVCSEHFDTDHFYITESGLRRLSGEAVPIVNNCPCHQTSPTISSIDPLDIKSTDTEEVVTLKHKVHRLEVLAENRRKRLQAMWQKKRRLKKKLQRMKEIVRNVIKIKKVNGQDQIDDKS